MDRNLKWRTLGLFVLVLYAVAALLPSLVPSASLPSWYGSLFESKIALGTDIDGGARFVYSIELDKAVDDRGSEIKRDLDTKFSDDGIKGTVRTPASPVGAVTVIVDDAARRPEVEKLLKSDYGDTITTRPCAPTDPAGAICFRVSSSFADGVKKTALRNAVNTIRERIDEKGIAEPSVIEKGDDIIVELPGLDDAAITRIKDIIARTAKLEFKVIDNGAPFMQGLYAQVAGGDPDAVREDIIVDEDVWTPEEGGGQQRDYHLLAKGDSAEEKITAEYAKQIECDVSGQRADADGKYTCQVPGWRRIERYVAALAAKDPKFRMPDDRQLGYEFMEADRDAERGAFWKAYYLDRTVRLTGSAVSQAMVNYDPNTNRPLVIVNFNRYGGRVFGELTAKTVGKKIATILDGKIKSAPVINQAIRGGTAQISMGGGSPAVMEREAADLVAVLKTGSLPAPLKLESDSKVGPSLGRDAVDKAKLSFGLGILLVVIIMIGIYKWSGIIAVGAVAVNILLMMSVMAIFGATLTLPGIAAIVLTVGMAVDGNILIYERIRDELLLGKSVRGAVDLGFARAFSAILDGQLTTAAAGWVLLSYGSGPIKGFAVMLLVGIVTTLFSNIWVSRLFFDWYLTNKKGQMATISI